MPRRGAARRRRARKARREERREDFWRWIQYPGWVQIPLRLVLRTGGKSKESRIRAAERWLAGYQLKWSATKFSPSMLDTDGMIPVAKDSTDWCITTIEDSSALCHQVTYFSKIFDSVRPLATTDSMSSSSSSAASDQPLDQPSLPIWRTSERLQRVSAIMDGEEEDPPRVFDETPPPMLGVRTCNGECSV